MMKSEWSLPEEEIDTVWLLLDVQSVLMSIVLQDDLFQIEESSLVVNSLSGLNYGLPCVLGILSLTSLALLGGDNVLDLERLLQDGRGKHLSDPSEGRGRAAYLFLDGELDFDTPRVGLGPDEAGIDEPDFV